MQASAVAPVVRTSSTRQRAAPRTDGREQGRQVVVQILGGGPAPAQPDIALHPFDERHPLEHRPRFGINSLINRMTGGHPAPQQAERAAPAVRAQPRLSAEYEEDSAADPDQERIEIPAFLRRQAN